MIRPSKSRRELLKKMTLEEKVGQLVQYSAASQQDPAPAAPDYPDMLAKAKSARFSIIVTAKETNAFQRSPSKNPAFIFR